MCYVWDEKKYRIVQEKHKVEFYEVVSAMNDPEGFEEPDLASDDERWIWVGQTVSNRVLFIVYSEEDLPLYRLITAFDAEGRWHDEYNKRERV